VAVSSVATLANCIPAAAAKLMSLVEAIRSHAFAADRIHAKIPQCGCWPGKQLLARFLTLSGDRLVPRALPLATQTSSPRFGGYFCSTSPEAMRTTVMAGPITGPGRVSPLRHRS